MVCGVYKWVSGSGVVSGMPTRAAPDSSLGSRPGPRVTMNRVSKVSSQSELQSDKRTVIRYQRSIKRILIDQ